MKTKFISKILCVLLSVTLAFGGTGIHVYADTNKTTTISRNNSAFIPELDMLKQSKNMEIRKNAREYYELEKELQMMSVEEINAFIDQCLHSSKPFVKFGKEFGSSSTARRNSGPLKAPALDVQRAAWYSAGTLLEAFGYKCTGTLIKCSVMGTDYRETENTTQVFRPKIRKSSAFTTWVENYKNGQREYSIAFEKNDSPDLYLSLHAVDISVDTQASVINHCTIADITDTYDFSHMDGSSLVAIVNNWAELAQNTSVLNVISVYIRASSS